MSEESQSLPSIGTESEVFSAIVGMLESFTQPGQEISPDSEIISDLNVDSVAVMDLVMELEDKFDISIPLDVIPKIRTVGDLAREVHSIRKGGR